jgi:hypothetical protein
MILGAYVGLVTLVSLVEIIALICFDQNWVKGANGWWDILYFNFMIILTVGYGDFAPLGFGKVLSSLEALAGVGLFAGGVSLLTIKALRPSAHTIVFSKYAYYCKKETARLGPPAALVARVLRDVSNDVLTDVTDVLEVACAEKFLDLSVDVVGVMMRNLR